MKKIFLIILLILVAKTMFGIHWNWEKCDCCGRTWREIRTEKSQTTEVINNAKL